MRIQEYLISCQQHVQQVLTEHLPSSTSKLHKAMRYAVLNGGKRLRPILIYSTGLALNVPFFKLDNPACAMEFIHCYSLIHDDLPAMDNDDVRRGQPTCHKAFDEATAILAGDALQTLAFKILCQQQSNFSAQQQIQMLQTLSGAAMSMIEGQNLDIESANKTLSLADLEILCRAKTGALFEASIKLGIITANCQDKNISAKLDNYARCLGLAYQIVDDMLDAETKPLEKSSYCYLLGKEAAKQKAEELYDKAVSNLEECNLHNSWLKELADYLVHREY